SLPPSSGVIKPKPLSALNHLTVPLLIFFTRILLVKYKNYIRIHRFEYKSNSFKR
ncbi:MAG: hypothetical protein ACI9WC_003247, partial [Arenicella sp.]